MSWPPAGLNLSGNTYGPELQHLTTTFRGQTAASIKRETVIDYSFRMFTQQSRRRHFRAVGLSGVALLLLVACGKDPVSIPNVSGVKLTDARGTLEGAGFDDIETKDFRGDRSPLVDGNWVVVGQDPAAESLIEHGSSVTLSIAKVDDDGVIDLLPKGSPVRADLEERAAESERKNAELERATRQREEQARQEDLLRVQEYADSIDAAARLVQAGVPDLVTASQIVSDTGRPSLLTSEKVRDIKDSLDIYSDLIESAPSSINQHVDFIQENLVKIMRAADLLNAVSPATADDTLMRFNELYSEARIGYNAGLTDVYAGTTLKAPTIRE